MNINIYNTIYKYLEDKSKSNYIKILSVRLKRNKVCKIKDYDIIDRLIDISNRALDDNIHYNESTINIQKKEIQIDHLYFISDEIKKYIYQNINMRNTITANFKDINLILNIYTLKNKINSIPTLNPRVIIQIVYVFACMKKNKIRDVNINIYDTPFVKKIDCYPCKTMGRDTINSGSTTYRGNVSHEINIWRVEEVYKVLFHELCHYFGIDDIDNNVFDFHNKFNISETSRIKPNESIAEISAIIMHHIFYSCKICRSERNVINEYNSSVTLNIKTLFFEKIQLERYYSLIQISKILYHFNFNSFDEFIRSSDISHGKELNQETSIFSYFFLKGVLLFDINEYFNFINDSMYVKREMSNDFNILLLNLLKKKEFIDQINSFIKWINRKEKRNTYKNFMETMKMSLINYM